MKQPLTDKELEVYAHSVANNARSRLEVRDKVWQFLPSFHREVYEEALRVLQVIVIHERVVK